TVKFSDTLEVKGARLLAEVPFLRSNASVVPVVIRPVQILSLDLPARYTLFQNYPNPFNPTTTIRFSLVNPAIVTLKVYTMLGQEIRTLIDNQMTDEGPQEVLFDGTNLASGIYFYRIVIQQPANEDDDIPAGYSVTTKKMMLIK